MKVQLQMNSSFYCNYHKQKIHIFCINACYLNTYCNNIVNKKLVILIIELDYENLNRINKFNNNSKNVKILYTQMSFYI